MEFPPILTLLNMEQIYWKRFPFVRMLPALVSGILLGKFINVHNQFLLIGLLLMAGIGIHFINKRSNKLHFVLHATIALIGFLGIQSSHQDYQAKEQQIKGFATIQSSLEVKPKTYKTTALVEFKNADDVYQSKKVILYIRKEACAATLQIGDKIGLNCKLQPIAAPKLKGSFNYKNYLAKQQIYYSAYVSDKNWTSIEKQESFQLQYLAEQQRANLASTINQYVPNNQGDLVKAITLGIKTDLDKSTKSNFSKTGIMHILAVSGLHVGIIWSLLSFCFQPIYRRKPSTKAYFILLEILGIWLFAFITGFAPSVQRAAFMFMLLSIAKLQKYDKDSLNIVAASAFILLFFNSKLLFAIGFQLSYAAVTSIILFYPKFYKSLNFKNTIADKVWSVQCVSFAAVIGTTPITLLYFNQFSLVFPITNLIAIPLAYFIVIATVLLLLMAKITAIASLLGIVIGKVVFFLKISIGWIANWSFASLNLVYIDEIGCILLATATVLFCLALYHPKQLQKGLVACLICINALMIYNASNKVIQYSETAQINVDLEGIQLINVGKNLYSLPVSADAEIRENLSGYMKRHLLYKQAEINMPQKYAYLLFDNAKKSSQTNSFATNN